jgi:hypothetical protein
MIGAVSLLEKVYIGFNSIFQRGRKRVLLSRIQRKSGG